MAAEAHRGLGQPPIGLLIPGGQNVKHLADTQQLVIAEPGGADAIGHTILLLELRGPPSGMSYTFESWP